MNTKGMTIEEICNELNDVAGNFRIGNLQEIRKRLKNLEKNQLQIFLIIQLFQIVMHFMLVVELNFNLILDMKMKVCVMDLLSH